MSRWVHLAPVIPWSIHPSGQLLLLQSLSSLVLLRVIRLPTKDLSKTRILPYNCFSAFILDLLQTPFLVCIFNFFICYLPPIYLTLCSQLIKIPSVRLQVLRGHLWIEVAQGRANFLKVIRIPRGLIVQVLWKWQMITTCVISWLLDVPRKS